MLDVLRETTCLDEEGAGSKAIKVILDTRPDGTQFIGISAGHGFIEIPIYNKQFAKDMYVACWFAHEREMK